MSAITNPIPLESSPPAPAIPPGAYYWSRNAAGYLYPTTTTDTVRVDQGSVTNPSYGFLNTAAALLTGMYYESADTAVAFTANGTRVGEFSKTQITFGGVTGAASNGGSVINLTTGTGGTNGQAGGAFTSTTGNGTTAAAAAGGAGGAYQVNAGAGAGQTTAFIAGAGGAIGFATGSGGAQSGAAAGAGGAGGAFTVALGGGGATNNTGNLAGGAAGSFTISAAAGGAVTGAGSTGAGGNGSNFSWTGGAGGSSTSGTGGAGGTYALTCGAGGVSANSSGGNGGTYDLNGGSGGNATAGTGNGGSGGNIGIYGGRGGTSFGGTFGSSGDIQIEAGQGRNSTNTRDAGDGGRLFLYGGTAGNNTGSGATGNGGAGNKIDVVGGQAGNTNSTGTGVGGSGGNVQVWGGQAGDQTGNGSTGGAGAGGTATLRGGTGGNASGAGSTGSGGAGGDAYLTPGTGGTTVGGTAGAQGRVKVQGTGIFAFANAQSIVPTATRTLILTRTAGANQSVVASTFIKIATDAANRQIVLPSESSSNGLYLVFANTSATNTMLLRDSANAATIATVAVSSQQIVMCDGTTWYPVAANSTPATNYWQRTGTVLTPATAGDNVSSPRAAAGVNNEVFGAGASVPTGARNTYLGNSVTSASPNSEANTIIGYQASIGYVFPFSGFGVSNSVIIGYGSSIQSGGASGDGFTVIVGAGSTVTRSIQTVAVGAQINLAGVGSTGAIAMGYGVQMTVASTLYSVAIGHSASMSSPYSVALGAAGNVATGDYSTVMGYASVSSAQSSIALGAGATVATANRCVIGGTVTGTNGNISSVIIGNGETAATPIAVSMMPTQASGSDKAGSDFTIRGGRNTGSGAGGTLGFDIYPAGASSSTAGTATNMQRIVSTYYNERRAGSGSGFANIAGGLFAAYTDSTSSGTAAQNLHSFTLIGNTLLHDGDSLVIRSAMALTTLGGNLTVACRLGTTDLTLFNAAAPAGATQAEYTVTITRTGAATQRVTGTISILATLPVTQPAYVAMAETLSGTLTLATRVTATVSGTVTNQLMTVGYFPAPQT